MMIPKHKPARSPKYLAFVRTLPCCQCAIPGPNHPHHEIGVGDGKTGGKAGDDRTMPMCADCHREFHYATGTYREAQIVWQAKWIANTQVAAKKAGVKVPA